MLKKCFFIRHQAAGILTDVIYLTPPNDEQLKAAKEKCEVLHGTHHPTLEEEHWVTVQEGIISIPDGTDLAKLEDAKLPETPTLSGDGEDGAGGLPRFKVSGTGTVTNPDGK